MNRLIGREDFENLLRSLAGALFHQIDSKIPNQAWLAIILDVRFDHQGGFAYKIRTEKPGDSVTITMPPDITLLVLSLDSLRRELLEDQWYGFRLTVTANQQCELDYNYDPNCATDPTFYAD